MSLCVHMNAGYYIFGGGRPKARQPVKLPTTEEEVGGGSLSVGHRQRNNSPPNMFVLLLSLSSCGLGPQLSIQLT